MAAGHESRTEGEVQEQPHLVFSVAEERYALPLSCVTSVQPEGPITRVPGASPYIRGITNLRGSLLAVVDLAGLLGLSPPPPGRGHIVVVRTAQCEAGLLVGQAEEVLSLPASAAEPRLSTLAEDRARFIQAQARHGGELIGLLHLERVLDAVRDA